MTLCLSVPRFALRLRLRTGSDRNPYTNDIIGSVPVRRQIAEEGYEVWDSNMYHKRPGPFVEATEEQIIRAAKRGLSIG